MPSLREFLLTAPAVECGSKQVVVVDANDTVQCAFETLIKFHVLSAPVYDSDKKEYTGMVDIVDILAFILVLYGENEEPDEGAGDTWKNFLNKEVFNKIPVKDVTDLSLRDPFVPVNGDAVLMDIVNILAKGRAKGVHRVCIVDKDGMVESIISQSGVISAIGDAIKEGKVTLPDGALAKSVADLKLGIKDVLTIGENEKAINAFRLMNKHGVSALAMIDDEDRLVGNISGRDFKAVRAQEDSYWFKDLFLGCMDFVAKVRRDEIHENKNKKTRSPIMVCYDNDTLEHVVRKLTATRVHRLYVESASTQALVGVVSLRDVLQELLKHCEE
eukprot:TRINITY_DN1857_c0_g1_i1.p1 TRINITY_DN1857_c0_g1~~TRINITY_DN1857_c0_g1_i1.p1  ORF type:complete len:330 (-),score=104.80 TRINITY_DN1857_c0_g1_i1:750-1739(-)